MENKDIYSSAPGEGMETKGVPGYVPAPLIRSDAPQPQRSEDGDATVTANDDEQGTPPGADGEGKGESAKQTTAKKTTTTTTADKK